MTGRATHGRPRLQAVALGDAPADVVLRGGRVALVERGEFQARDVAIVDDRIAALPHDAGDVIGEETTVVGADDCAVLPGLIDAHTHADINQTIETAYPRYLETGTTTLVTEASSLSVIGGAAGTEALLAASTYLPITVRVTVPPQPLFDTFEPAWADEDDTDALLGLLEDDRVVGVGETDWIHVVGRDPPATDLYERARALGKRVVGHGAGCSGAKLAAFASVVDDDHEAIDPEGIEERLEQGLHVVGRSGSIRNDVGALASAIERGADSASLSTDGVWPRDLAATGAMDHAVARLLAEGVAPMDAIRTATLHPARHFGLDDRGSLAPGAVADAVIVEDLTEMSVRTVVSGGELVARNGSATVSPRPHTYPEALLESVHVDVSDDDLLVPADVADDGAVRAIEHDRGLLTAETTARPARAGDALVAAPDRDVAKAVLWDRRPDASDVFAGFVTGLGLDEGAVATTLTWETPGLLAIGASDDAIAAAATHLAAIDGGWVVVRDGDPIAELPLRVGGVAADLDLAETASLYGAVERALGTIGVDADRPLLAVQTLSFPGAPALRMGPTGYRDVFERRVVGL